MTLDEESCYRALRSRDRRFDGTFFVGVVTTGIYCRPICPARTPARGRCRFFASAAVAEREGYRACLRCRPEIAPGNALVDARSRLTSQAMARIEEGFLDGASVEALARELSVSARHLRRTVEAELGASPIELAQTQRLALAKRLLHDSDLSIADVAMAAGFGSLRRFNALFARRFGCAPSSLRRSSAHTAPGIRLRLDYRPPLCWKEMVAFLGARAIPGVERVAAACYQRAVRIGPDVGWIEVRPFGRRDALEVSISHSLSAQVAPIACRLRAVFDLDSHPDRIDAELGADRRLRPLVAARPGMRVPGAFDAFELGVRAILGQQVSVSAATTLAGRFVQRFGKSGPCGSPLPRIFPTPEEILTVDAASVQSIGVPTRRATSIVALARALASGELSLDRGTDPLRAVAALQEIPGIGPWTASYVSMRALGWPDAFPAADLVLRRALGCRNAREVEQRSARWRPWRAYAALHLWTHEASGG